MRIARTWGAGLMGLLVGAGVGHAGVLATSTIVAADPATGGRVRIVSTVTGLTFGTARYSYEVTNLSYAPDPATANGLSGLRFGDFITLPVADPSGPPGWVAEVVNDTEARFTVAYGVGMGLGVGETGVFEYTGDSRFTTSVAVADVPGVDYGTAGHTHDAAGPTGPFFLLDEVTGIGVFIPAVPAPGVLGVAGLAAAAGFARRRRG